tara:strand:- start:7855 stop:8181 length:327 start_codon:yes stop_codon:yes gene_type:complete
MVCELAQNEIFQKMLIKKVEKLRKQVEDLKRENKVVTDNRDYYRKMYEDLHKEDLIHLLHIVELKKEKEKLQKDNKKLKKENKELHQYHKIGKLLGNVGKGYKPVANR